MLTVGELLKKSREEKGLDLSTVEKAIRVRAKFLKEIENNNWSVFPSQIYIAGIIKNYANFLGVDSKKMLAFFRRDYEKKEETKFKRKVSDGYLKPETQKIIRVILLSIFIFIFLYFTVQLKNYLTPPKIVLISPKTDRFIVEDKIKIVGKTEKDTMIMIFGERIYQNSQGVFEYQLPLHQGVNELIIELTGANGRKTIFRKNFYKIPN
ncbi:MAG: helix-turn-helix domain-containing protein [Microgenomates group bacterium]